MADLGTDLSCVTDLTSDCAEVSGQRCWLENLARRLQTTLGSLIDDPDYGFDVADLLDDEILPSQLANIAGQVDGEFLKDERTLQSSTVVTMQQSGAAIALTITSRVRSALGPFTLVLSVSRVTVTVLSTLP